MTARITARGRRRRLAGDGFAVFAGGMAGTGLRSLAAATIPEATLTVNLLGALCLGLLLGLLRRVDRSPRLRLFLATGILGSFTTYGTFVLETTRLPAPGAVLYAAVSLIGGGCLAVCGLQAGRSLAKGDHRR